MELRNADGSLAEMSGNGIRCLAQAVFQAGLAEPPVLRVATAAGLRTVTALAARRRPHAALQRRDGPGQGRRRRAGRGWSADVLRATRVDVGNPHLVLLWDGDAARVATSSSTSAPGSTSTTPGGANIEIVLRGPGPDELTMVVYERGVGPTQACGTGACAVAAAAHHWGLAGRRPPCTCRAGPWASRSATPCSSPATPPPSPRSTRRGPDGPERPSCR